LKSRIELIFSQFAKVLYNLSVDCAKEPNPQKAQRVFQFAMKKNFFVFYFLWVMSSTGKVFGRFGSGYLAGPEPKPLHESISLKFLLETRLEFKSFELLISFVTLLG